MRYRFTRPVMADGKSYQEKQEIDARDLAPGTLQSALYVGHLEPVAEEKRPPAAQPVQAAKK